MDLSKLSDSDLQALQKGDLSKVSDQGLAIISGKKVQAPKPYDVTKDMTGFERFAAGAGKAVYDIGRGAGQMLNLVSQKDIDEAKAMDANLMNTSEGSWGNVVGNVLATAPTMFIPGVNTVVGGAAMGAGLGAIQPVATGESRLQNTLVGGGVGAALPAAANLLKAGRAALYDPIANQERVLAGALRRSVGDQAPDVVNQLRTFHDGATPGVRLSAGTVAQNEGLAALEDAITSQLPSGELARSGQVNRMALADALRGIAGTPEDMTKALARRGQVADNLYDMARVAGPVPESLAPEAQANIAQFMQRIPDGIVEQAKRLAKINGTPMTNENSVQGLHWIKKAIDGEIGAAVRSGNNDLARAYQGLQKDLLTGLDNISPMYGDARRTFQELSKPINQMEVGNALANKLIPATAGDAPASLNYASLARSMRDPDAVAQAATGFDGAKMAKILSPEQMATVQGVTSDASRIAEALKRGMGSGSPTARRLAQGDILSQHFAEQAPITSRVLEIVGKVPGANLATKGVSAIGSMATDKINANLLSKLDQMLANDPQKVARLIQQELARVSPSEAQKVLRALPQSLMLGVPASVEAAH